MKYLLLSILIIFTIICGIILINSCIYSRLQDNENFIIMYYSGDGFPDYELQIENEIIAKGKLTTTCFVKIYEFTKTNGKSVLVKINGNIVGRGGTTSYDKFRLIIVTNGSSIIFDEL